MIPATSEDLHIIAPILGRPFELGSRYPITDHGLAIGGDETNDVMVEGTPAQLCRLERRGHQCVAVAAGNEPVTVNRKQVHKRVLKDGDRLRISCVEYVYFSGADAHHKLEQLVEDDCPFRDLHLTGAINRRAFLQELKVRIRRGDALSVLMFDLDQLKQVNDERGMSAGGQVLRTVADIAQDILSPVFEIARFGGDEFASILLGKSAVEAHAIAEEIRHAVANAAIVADGEAVDMTISCGVAELGTFMLSSDILRAAEDAMWTAKCAGRNQTARADTR